MWVVIDATRRSRRRRAIIRSITTREPTTHRRGSHSRRRSCASAARGGRRGARGGRRGAASAVSGGEGAYYEEKEEEGRDSETKMSVAVYCGSRPGARAAYTEAATALGKEIANRNMRLVYGGGDVGLMGAVASAVRTNGGKVTGVIPTKLIDAEANGKLEGDTVVVDNMHERKAKMSELADVFVALPGGLGTLEELFEMAAHQQLGFHTKAVGVLNVEGFFDNLLAFIAHANTEAFISDKGARILISDSSPAALLDKLLDYTPPADLSRAHHEGKK